MQEPTILMDLPNLSQWVLVSQYSDYRSYASYCAAVCLLYFFSLQVFLPKQIKLKTQKGTSRSKTKIRRNGGSGKTLRWLPNDSAAD